MTCADCRAEGADCLTADRVRVCSDCLYERVVKERDEARACLAFERVTVAELRAEVERLRAEVERFRNAVREKERLELEALQELDEALDALRTVAERQREACAEWAAGLLDSVAGDCVRATPLVTEGDK